MKRFGILGFMFWIAIAMISCKPLADPLPEWDSSSDLDTDVDSDTDTDTDTDTDGDTDSDSDTDTDGDGDTDADSESESASDTDVCEELDIEIERLPIRLMLLQDMSGSMNDPIEEDDPSQGTKWDVVTEAVTHMVGEFASQIRFGLDLFPNEDSDATMACGVADPVQLDCGVNTEGSIVSLLGQTAPAGSTPLYLALENFLQSDYAPEFVDSSAASYLLVLSDGEDTCGENPFDPDDTDFDTEGFEVTPAELAELTRQLLDTLEIRTFVIGFAINGNSDQLNAIAENGGTAFDHYLDAQDQSELEGAIEQIANAAMDCVYEIGEFDETEVDVDQPAFLFDDVIVPEDPGCGAGNGWMWQDKLEKVEFCKDACEKLKNGEVSQVVLRFACP